MSVLYDHMDVVVCDLRSSGSLLLREKDPMSCFTLTWANTRTCDETPLKRSSIPFLFCVPYCSSKQSRGKVWDKRYSKSNVSAQTNVTHFILRCPPEGCGVGGSSFHFQNYCIIDTPCIIAQLGSAQLSADTPSDLLYHTIPLLSLSLSLSFSSLPSIPLHLPLSLSSFACVFSLSLTCQCCRRTLVAMLTSLLEALRACRASFLEKPISTNKAT